MDSTEKNWTDKAKNLLLGRKIVAVRYMTQKEADSLGWHSRGVVIQLDNGLLIYPSRYDEVNDSGALFTSDENEPTLPVL